MASLHRLPPLADTFKLLVMTPFPLRLDSPHGGRTTAALTLALAKRHRVAVVCLRGAGEPGTDEAIRRECEIVEEVERPEWSPNPGWRGRFAQLGKLVGAAPALVERTRVPAYTARLRAVEDAFRPDVVQAEPHEMAHYLRALEHPAKRVLVDHDPGRQAAGDYRRATKGLRRLWRRLDEVAWWWYGHRTGSQIDAVVVFSDRDRRSVESYAGSKPIEVIPFHVSVPERAPVSTHDSSRVLFYGGYDHPPNADAAARLALRILPCVWRHHPSATLELVGETTEQVQALAAGEAVLVRGHVESVEPYLAAATVVAIPIRMGGGRRIKVLESLAAGKAVVASPRAVEGINATPGRELLVAESDQEFCDAISSLLEHEERRLELGAAARRWAAANLEPDQSVQAYEALYRRLLAAEG